MNRSQANHLSRGLELVRRGATVIKSQGIREFLAKTHRYLKILHDASQPRGPVVRKTREARQISAPQVTAITEYIPTKTNHPAEPGIEDNSKSRVLINQDLNDSEIEGSVEHCQSWPKTLVLNLGSQCNNLCRFCCQTQFHKWFEYGTHLSVLNLQKLEKIFGDCDRGWPMNVDLQGDGEPLIQKDFREVYCFCREKFPESAIRICTNGLALNQSMSDFLIAGKVGWVNVSLNAGSSAVYETVCGSKRFDKIIENVRYLIELMRQRGDTVPAVGMSYVLARYNMGDLENFVRLLAALGVKNAHVPYMTANSHEMLADSVIHEKQRTNRVLDRVGKLADKLDVHVTLPERFPDATAEVPLSKAPPIAKFDFRSARIQLARARRKAISQGVTPCPPEAGLKDLTKIKMVQREPVMRCT